MLKAGRSRRGVRSVVKRGRLVVIRWCFCFLLLKPLVCGSISPLMMCCRKNVVCKWRLIGVGLTCSLLTILVYLTVK